MVAFTEFIKGTNSEELTTEGDNSVVSAMNALIVDINNITPMFKMNILRKITEKSKPAFTVIFDYVPTEQGIITSYEFAPKVKDSMFQLAKKHLGEFSKKPSDLKPVFKGKQIQIGAVKKEDN